MLNVHYGILICKSVASRRKVGIAESLRQLPAPLGRLNHPRHQLVHPGEEGCCLALCIEKRLTRGLSRSMLKAGICSG